MAASPIDLGASPLEQSIQILSIEADPVIQSGLVSCLNRFADLQIVAEAEDVASAWQILTAPVGETRSIDLLLVGVPLVRVETRSTLVFCQQIKARFPNLPILLLIAPQHPDLTTAFQLGIEGCCLRGGSILDLVAGIRRVVAGQTNWTPTILQQVNIGTQPHPGVRGRLRLSSLQQIEASLAALNIQLNNQRLSTLDRLVLLGRKRELTSAQWLVKRLFPGVDPLPLTPVPPLVARAADPALAPSLGTSSDSSPSLQNLYDRIAAKLQSNLENLTPTPLEIDILRPEKKRELCYLILRQFEGLLAELRFSQVTLDQLPTKVQTILQDLWASVTTDFFGRYQTLSIDGSQIEIIPTLLQDVTIVHTEILTKIAQPLELLNYLLFNTSLTIDNTICPAGSNAAQERAGVLLENLTIHLANAVMQPLLNRFGNLESMKSGFYDRRLLSSREIERFRNDLSWRYRIDRYIGEPQAIFESQYRLLTFTPHGISRISIYAPRPQELERLAGIPLVVTLTLEVRDALSPRIKSATTFIGSSIVYLLTEIIGRGIGLIGRGIVKGIGNIWQESNRNRRE
jgi:DNA-binding NarL/FixJ family response regulator